MFRYNVRGENIEVTEAIRDYVEKKVGKLERYFSDSPEATVHVNLKVIKARREAKRVLRRDSRSHK
ncbi:ribosome hibernation-promoting factor, HPF/YfiA family, partial [Enterococcus faecalis]|uniref:ribosome hibernation-promoting factor, HPF/YfiA family n=1 Tax=Enterococcus faecalis TaxID=1351 RepID=UPI0034A0F034